MFKFISVIVIQAVFALTIQGSDSDEVCLPTWRRKEGIHSIGGTEVADSTNVNSLTKCLIYCQSTVGCLAVDFNHLENSCWMHFDPAYNSSDSVYDDDPSVSQYSLETCVSFKVSKKECPSSWHTSANKSSSSSYVGIGLANFSSCFSYCRFTDSCNGIAFDSSSWPFCKVYSSLDFADPHNLVENPSSTIYLFDKKECLANPSNKSYARCVGETFPQVSQWCPEGSNVTITSLIYRDNPFCCKDVLQQNIYPLDNSQLATFNLDYFAKSYSESIRNCLLNRSCILRAELNASFVSKSVCLTDEKAPNSVSILFTCSKLQIDSATNLSTSTILLPVSSSLPVYTFPEVPSETTFPTLAQPLSTVSSANATSLPSFTSSTATLSNATSNSLASSSSSSPAIDTTSSSSGSPTSTFPLPTDAVSSPSSTSTVIPNTISLSLSSSQPTINMTSATSVGYFQNVTLSPSASPTSTFPLPTDAVSSPSSSSAVIPNTTSLSPSSSYEVTSSPTIYTTSVTNVATLSNFAKNVSIQYPTFAEPTVSLPPTNATASTTSKSPEKTNDPSTGTPSTKKENKERTALVLGALGTTFGLLSLLLLVLLVVLFCRNLRNDGSDMFDTVSWKNIIHGSSSV